MGEATPTPWAMPTPTPWAMPHRLVHRDLPNAHAGLVSQTARQTARQSRHDHHPTSIQLPRGMRQECLRWSQWTSSMARHLGKSFRMAMRTVTVLMTVLVTCFVTAKVLAKLLATLPSTARIAEEEWAAIQEQAQLTT